MIRLMRHFALLLALIISVMSGAWLVVPWLLADTGPSDPDPRSVALARLASCAPLRWDFSTLSAPALRESDSVGGDWRVQRLTSRHGSVLQQTAAQDLAPSLLFGQAFYADFDAALDLRVISGGIEGAAGMIFRAASKRDFYLFRVNTVEGNIELFVVANGMRYKIAERRMQFRWQTWYRLGVQVRGDSIRCLVNGKTILRAEHGRLAAGYIGLWTKGDSRAEFDNLAVHPVCADEGSGGN